MRPITAKGHYKALNWSEYDKALVKRGEIRLWVDEAALAGWRTETKSGKRGASRKYTDAAIRTMATLRVLFNLPGRAVEGFLRSLFELMGVDLPVPDHSTLSRRLGELEIELAEALPAGPIHLVMDSSGFKVYGKVSGRFVSTVLVSAEPGSNSTLEWMKPPGNSSPRLPRERSVEIVRRLLT